MPIANYTTEVSAKRSVAEIVEMLRVHNATDIVINYAQMKPKGLAFIIETRHGGLPFQLPANIEKVYAILLKDKRASWQTEVQERTRLQAERVAWRILRDWTRAQMAIIETEMVTIEQVFLPYLQLEGKSLYDILAEGQFKFKQLKGGT